MEKEQQPDPFDEIPVEQRVKGQNFGILQRLNYQCFLIQNLRSNIDDISNIPRYENSLFSLYILLKQFIYSNEIETYNKVYINKKFEIAEKLINQIKERKLDELVIDSDKRSRMLEGDRNRLIGGHRLSVSLRRSDLLWEALTELMIDNGLMFHTGLTYEM